MKVGRKNKKKKVVVLWRCTNKVVGVALLMNLLLHYLVEHTSQLSLVFVVKGKKMDVVLIVEEVDFLGLGVNILFLLLLLLEEEDTNTKLVVKLGGLLFVLGVFGLML